MVVPTTIAPATTGPMDMELPSDLISQVVEWSRRKSTCTAKRSGRSFCGRGAKLHVDAQQHRHTGISECDVSCALRSEARLNFGSRVDLCCPARYRASEPSNEVKRV